MIPMAISIISFLFIGAVNGGPAYEEVYSHPGAIEPEQDVPLMYIDIVEEMHFEMDITVHSLLSHYKKFFQCTDGGDYTKVLYIETHHDGQLVPKWTTADSIWGTNTPKKGIVAGETYHLEMDMAPGSWTVTLDGVVVYDRTELGDPLTLENIPCYIFSNSINGGADVTVSNLFIGVPEDDVPSCSGPVSVDDIVFTPSGMSWGAANNWCSAQGMELVSIHDEESQNAVYEACKTGWSEGTSFSRVWFGLNAIDQSFSVDNFMWSDGSDVDYTNWRDGHPRIDEECIMMYCGGGGSQGTWASHECSWHQPYGVCRRCSDTANTANDDILALLLQQAQQQETAENVPLVVADMSVAQSGAAQSVSEESVSETADSGSSSTLIIGMVAFAMGGISALMLLKVKQKLEKKPDTASAQEVHAPAVVHVADDTVEVSTESAVAEASIPETTANGMEEAVEVKVNTETV